MWAAGLTFGVPRVRELILPRQWSAASVAHGPILTWGPKQVRAPLGRVADGWAGSGGGSSPAMWPLPTAWSRAGHLPNARAVCGDSQGLWAAYRAWAGMLTTTPAQRLRAAVGVSGGLASAGAGAPHGEAVRGSLPMTGAWTFTAGLKVGGWATP